MHLLCWWQTEYHAIIWNWLVSNLVDEVSKEKKKRKKKKRGKPLQNSFMFLVLRGEYYEEQKTSGKKKKKTSRLMDRCDLFFMFQHETDDVD